MLHGLGVMEEQSNKTKDKGEEEGNVFDDYQAKSEILLKGLSQICRTHRDEVRAEGLINEM